MDSNSTCPFPVRKLRSSVGGLGTGGARLKRTESLKPLVGGLFTLKVFAARNRYRLRNCQGRNTARAGGPRREPADRADCAAGASATDTCRQRTKVFGPAGNLISAWGRRGCGLFRVGKRIWAFGRLRPQCNVPSSVRHNVVWRR